MARQPVPLEAVPVHVGAPTDVPERRKRPDTGNLPTRQSRWWARREAIGQRVFVVLLAVLLAMTVVTLGARSRAVRDDVLMVIGAAAPILTMAAVRWYRPAVAWLWRLVAAAELSWGVGIALDPHSTLHLLRMPISLFELASTAGYLCALGALTAMVRTTDPGRRTLTLSDSIIVVVAVFSLLWGVNRWTIVTGRSDLSTYTSFLFPIADCLLAVAVVRVAARTTIARPGYLLCLSAVATLVVADVAILFEPVSGDRRYTSTLQFLVLAQLVLAVAHPSMSAIKAADAGYLGDIGRLRIVVLGASLVAPPFTLLALGPDVDRMTACVLACLCAVALALVLLRLRGMVTVVEEQSSQLAGIARSDPLTRLPNRRTVDAELDRAIADAATRDEPLVVGLLDLDHFKAYNDLRGHGAGDRLLTGVAAGWRQVLPPDVFLGRYGGEEFLVVVRGRDLEDVASLVESLRPTMPAGATFSAGLASWDGLEAGAVLVSRADVALYAAKDAGRATTWETPVPGMAARPAVVEATAAALAAS